MYHMHLQTVVYQIAYCLFAVASGGSALTFEVEIIVNINLHFVYLQYTFLYLCIYMCVQLPLTFIKMNVIVLISFQVNAGEMRKLMFVIIIMYKHKYTCISVLCSKDARLSQGKQMDSKVYLTNPLCFQRANFFRFKQ